MVILRQHYTQGVEKELKALSEFSKQDWEGPFEIATSWAKRNLGRCLQPDSLEQARAEIVAKLGDLRTAAPTEERRYMTHLHLATTSKTTTATMTTHVTGDWSPFSEREQEQERELTPSSPPESSQPAEPNLATPKEQRVLRFAASIPETPAQERPCSPSIQPPQSGEMLHTEVLDLTQGEFTPEKTKRVNTITVAKPQPVSHPGPSRSGLDRLTSCVQTRLQLQAAEESSSSSSSSLPPSPASPGQQVRTPTRHPNTHRKLRDWHLHVKEPWLIVGDSNVSRLPPFAADTLQIDGFPGAKWWHAEYLLEKATITTPVTKLILSFGINNRSQGDKNVPVLELKRALKVAREKFPEADLYVPEINFSSALPQVEKDTLIHLNTFITGLKEHIPALASDIFTTEKDDIHWSYGTSEAMLQHWEMYVNGESP
ncbi:growth hormone [Sarotherodon galilaeus]